MNNELLLQLAREQEKIRAIHKLSNCIHKVTSKEKDEIAHFIHRIIESENYNTDIARELMQWQIRANKELFMTV